MYKAPKFKNGSQQFNKSVEGEPIERKIERMLNNGEPIEGEAQPIYTERSMGVIPTYNIKTDRLEQALEAKEKLEQAFTSKLESRRKEKKGNGGAESIQGEGGQATTGGENK